MFVECSTLVHLRRIPLFSILELIWLLSHACKASRPSKLAAILILHACITRMHSFVWVGVASLHLLFVPTPPSSGYVQFSLIYHLTNFTAT